MERTIRSIKSLTRANITDGLTFEDSVQLAIKTLRQTPHTRLNTSPFQVHFGRKPRTAITNLIGQPQCLLSNWKKTLTNYISAQPTELQVFTINDSEGEMADYLILNDTRKRARSSSRRPDELRKPTNRCRRCGKFSQGHYCHSRTLPTMPHEEPVQDEELSDRTDEEELESQTTPHAEEITQDEEESTDPKEHWPRPVKQPPTRCHYRRPSSGAALAPAHDRR